MSAPNKIYIVGTGMITPVGGNSAMTIAAVNARVSAYAASSFYNRRDKPMTTTSVPEDALPPLSEKLAKARLTGREKRLIRLAAPALEEVLANYSLQQPLPLFLAGPESLFKEVKPITAQLLRHIQTQTDANIDLRSSRFFAAGRSGAIEAINLAFRYFSATNAPYVLIGGVDSFLDAATLGYLDIENRVAAEDIADGFTPGEGASFLLLFNGPSNDDMLNIAALFPPGLGIEKGHRYSDAPYLGQGLADAFSSAIANGDNKKITEVFSSMNGENFFAKEFGVATIRNATAFAEDCSHEHPIDCLGDLGSAIAPVLIALAQHKLLTSKKVTQNLIYCSSDLAARAAVCIATIT